MSLRSRLVLGVLAFVAPMLLVDEVVTSHFLTAYASPTGDGYRPDAPELPGVLTGSVAAAENATASITVTSLRQGTGGEAVTDDGALGPATPLSASDMRRLLAMRLALTAVVLAAAGVLALWLLRRELRPLERIGETARAVAAGDLSRRVEPADARTEAGKLGLAVNAMLAHAQDAIAERKASEEGLRRFVADASHELRTPLTSIQGYAELFRRGAAGRPEDLAMGMRRIESEAARVARLVDELLLLAKLDQGRPLERCRVDLTTVAADAVAATYAVNPKAPVRLETNGSVLLTGDADRLRQVVDNLLSNALQHTPAGTPIHVRAGVDGGLAVLEVADEGPGVPPDKAARIFERFYRADPSRQATQRNTGLGLSIVAAIAEAHQGRATYEPAPGGGALFRVTLPSSAGNGQHPT